MRFFIFIALFLSIFFLSAQSAKAAEMPKAGDKAPAFTLKDQAENYISLDAFHGKWVVLYFYPQDLSPGCSIEARNFQRDIIQYTEKNTEVIGVSVDSPARHRVFCAEQDLTFTLLSDEKSEVIEQYGSLTEKGLVKIANRNTFIIDREGFIRKVYIDVKPATHSREVLIELDKLQQKNK